MSVVTILHNASTASSTTHFASLLTSRPEAVPRRVVGAADPSLGQAGEGLPHEEQPLRHQQDPRHLRLHQVRPAAQPAHAAVRARRGALHVLQGSRRHRHPTGRSPVHNQRTLQYERAEELFMCSKALADIVIPQVGRRCTTSARCSTSAPRSSSCAPRLSPTSSSHR